MILGFSVPVPWGGSASRMGRFMGCEKPIGLDTYKLAGLHGVSPGSAYKTRIMPKFLGGILWSGVDM